MAWVFAIPGLYCILTSLFLAAQAGAAVLYQTVLKHSRFRVGDRARCIVIIPAHNEAANIRTTLASVFEQKAAGDRVLVVADNCNDDTAGVSQRFGAEVTVRTDTTLIGKGFALAHGFDSIASDAKPDDIVVFLDADCVLGDGGLDELVGAASIEAGPVQSCYLMNNVPGQSLEHRVSTFAWNMRNGLRAVGSFALGIPAQITGSGIAVSALVCSSLDLGRGHLAEDLKMGVEAAIQARSPRLVPFAKVYGVLATTKSALHKQQKRWQQGHRDVFARDAARLIVAAFRTGRPRLILMAVDLGIPPLGVLILINAMALLVGVAGTLLTGNPMPTLLATASFTFLILFLAAGASLFGGPRVGLADCLTLPMVILGKCLRSLRNLSGTRLQWTRTDRG